MSIQQHLERMFDAWKKHIKVDANSYDNIHYQTCFTTMLKDIAASLRSKQKIQHKQSLDIQCVGQNGAFLDIVIMI